VACSAMGGSTGPASGWLDGAGGRPAAGSFGAVRMEASGDGAVLFSRFKSGAAQTSALGRGKRRRIQNFEPTNVLPLRFVG
jgi:hypothetical protein